MENHEIEFLAGKKTESYFLDRQLHREGGPARIFYYSSGQIIFEEYWYKGLKHRYDGPAEIIYYLSGARYRERYYTLNTFANRSGPSTVTYYESGKIKNERFTNWSNKHREDGPAYIEYSETGEIITAQYFLHGQELSEEKFNQRLADEIARKRFYSNGLPYSVEEYYKHGKLHRKLQR